MKISYEELIEYLNIGDEIEFEYNSKKYSINSTRNGWYLTEFYNEDNNYQFENTQDLIRNGTICGKHIKDIWEEVNIIAIY